MSATQSNCTEAPIVSPSEAHTRKANGWTHLDVRTEEEFNRIHAPNSVHIPFWFKIEGRVPNPDFMPTVHKMFSADTRLVVSCGNGGRSGPASTMLIAAGYSNVANIEGGMDAWSSVPNLPTESS